MDLLEKLIWLALVPMCFFFPLPFALKGIGTKRVWLYGGLVSFGALLMLSLMGYAPWSGPPPSVTPQLSFDGNPPPWTFTVGYERDFCFAFALGFILAGICYRPKKQLIPTLLGNLEGRVPNARRAN